MSSAASERRRGLSVSSNQWSVSSKRLNATFHFSLITFLLLSACTSVSPVVKIGLVAPFEGAQREVGYDAIYAARLAVREINEAGGIAGYHVALVALDDGGNAEMAAETAASLAIDPAVVAVIGHGLAQTTAVAQPVYAQAGLSLLPLGEAPFTLHDPTLLPADFRAAYSEVTPFDETAGPYAAATYDAMQLLFLAMAASEATTGKIDRDSVTNNLAALKYEGLVGTVYQP